MATSAKPGRPKLARIWRGRTLKEKADEYERYWLANGIVPLQDRGALAVQMLRDDRGAETEFMTISYWDSIEAMTNDPKADPYRAHALERDVEFLIELPQRVQILAILESRGPNT
jgi:heme-degrading monooxygenase HmoA